MDDVIDIWDNFYRLLHPKLDMYGSFQHCMSHTFLNLKMRANVKIAICKFSKIKNWSPKQGSTGDRNRNSGSVPVSTKTHRNRNNFTLGAEIQNRKKISVCYPFLWSPSAAKISISALLSKNSFKTAREYRVFQNCWKSTRKTATASTTTLSNKWKHFDNFWPLILA